MLNISISGREAKVTFRYEGTDVTKAYVDVPGVTTFVGVARRNPSDQPRHRVARKVALTNALKWMGLSKAQRADVWRQVWDSKMKKD